MRLEEELIIFLAICTDLANLDKVSRFPNLQDVNCLVAKRHNTYEIIIEESPSAMCQIYKIIAEGLLVKYDTIVQSGKTNVRSIKHEQKFKAEHMRKK